MIDPRQLRDFIVTPTLKYLALPSDKDPTAATELLLGTAMQESKCGMAIAQYGGPALGVWQIEPLTATDLVQWLHTRPDLETLVVLHTGSLKVDDLPGNLYLACALARLYYYRVKAALPAAGDIPAQAAYYKQYYNTPEGAATTTEYLVNWAALQHALQYGPPS